MFIGIGLGNAIHTVTMKYIIATMIMPFVAIVICLFNWFYAAFVISIWLR